MKKRALALLLAALTALSVIVLPVGAADDPGFTPFTDYYGRSSLARLSEWKDYLFVYDKVVEAIAAHEDVVDLTNTSCRLFPNRLYAVMTAVYFDMPQFFWYTGLYSSYEFPEEWAVAKINLYYSMSAEEAAEAKVIFDAEAAKILSGVDPSMSDLDIELYLHDVIAERTVYDLNAPHADDAYGPIVDGAAACKGYAKAFQTLLYLAGIPAHYTRSETHAWNYVKIGGEWYQTDVTWDDPSGGVIHDYFNLTDAMMAEETTSHVKVSNGYSAPECRSIAAYFKNIRSVDLGGRTLISNRSFIGFDRLESVTIRDTVTSIGAQAFSGCAALKSVTIPGRVTKLGKSAFRQCTGLTEVVMESGTSVIADHAFDGCAALTRIILPDGVTSVGSCAFENCGAAAVVMIPESVTSIGVCAFYNCPSLKTVIYTGSRESWDKISIASGNKTITEADIRFGEHVHDYYVYKTWASCSTGGMTTFVCSLCLDEYTAYVPYLEHDYIPTVIESTCTEGGSATYVCSFCGDSYVEYTEALGHSFSDWTVVIPATFDAEGEAARVCSRCRLKETRAIPRLVHGDVNGDGSLNAKDVVAIMRMMTGWYDGDVFAEAADFDANGRVNAKDAILLMKAIAEKKKK